MRAKHAPLIAIFVGLWPLFGQGLTVVGSGYFNPVAMVFAPGQITTIFVSGLTVDPTMRTPETIRAAVLQVLADPSYRNNAQRVQQ